jgi:hypothetical protein
LIDRLRAFVASGDLACVGDLRFVWARRDGPETSYVALWSEGPLAIRSAFPAQGDAPGADLPELPRPAHSVRILSAWQEQQAPMLAGYQSPGSASALSARYWQQLVAAGFVLRPLPSSAECARCLQIESGRSAAIAVFSEDEGRGAVVTLAPLR